MQKRPTMQDVAEKAGVSKATVSHVINETRFVSPETKERVIQVIEGLGYRPSVVARSLRTSRTQTIGLLVSDISNTFFSEVLHGAEDVLRAKNYSSVVCSTYETPEYEAHYLDLLLQQRVDGLIAAAGQQWDALTQFQMQHLPVVFIDRTFEGLVGPFVGVANHQEAYRGTAYLIERGHRRVAVMAGSVHLSSLRERVEGVRAALNDHGLSLPEAWIIPKSPTEEAQLRDVLQSSERPTAIFACTSSLSLKALTVLKEIGLRCPEDCALLGFDNHPWAAVANPPLTVIQQPAREIGRTAAKLLLAQLDGEALPDERIILDCQWIQRGSC